MELFLLNEVSSMLHNIIWYVLPIFSMHSIELGNNAANLWGQREIFPFGHFISKSRQSWFSKQNSHQIRIIQEVYVYVDFLLSFNCGSYWRAKSLFIILETLSLDFNNFTFGVFLNEDSSTLLGLLFSLSCCFIL